MPLAPPVIKIVLLVSFIIKYLGGQSARERRCGLDSKPFINQVRFDFPRKRSGHASAQDAVQPAWNDFGAVFPLRALGPRSPIWRSLVPCWSSHMTSCGEP